MKENCADEKKRREADFQYMQDNIHIILAWSANPGVKGAYDYELPACVVKSMRMSDFRGLFD